MTSTATLPNLTELLSNAVLGLEVQGYSKQQAEAAVKRARNWAQRMAIKVRPELQEQVFEDLFRSEIQKAPDWIEGYKKGMTAVR